jgi:LCP family protein required for cell wall assembly
VIPASDETPARSTGRSMRRFLGGGALIALLTMVTISTAVFEGVSTIADVLGKGHLITSAYLTPAGPGQAQTILLIGSDKRALSKSLADRNSPPHTDTIILIRLDSDLGLVSVMSVPRDLLVPSFTFKGQTYHDQKINYAYTVGNVYGSKATDGDNLTLRVVEKALDNIKINDIIDLNFESFVKVVSKLGCVYVDVDHWYYNAGNNGYSAIDVKPGYQCLRGYRALDYVRYRHTDSTYARDARQQDFLRQAKQQLGATGLLNNYQTILDSLGNSISTNIRGATAVLHLVQLALGSIGGPVRQITFPDNQPVVIGGSDYQTATPSQIRATVDQFLSKSKSVSVLPPSQPTVANSRHGHRAVRRPAATGLSVTPDTARTQALNLSTSVPFKVYLPTLTYNWTAQDPSLLDYYAYRLKDLQGNEHWAYHIAWQDTLQTGGYYGIEGTDWTDPPLFANADIREYGGRQYKLVGNGHHIQDIGWIVGNDLYWISNTIFDDLSNKQMIALAESAQPVA